jgi:hypothetical protein
MPTTTISPQVRIGALVGVLMTVLAGSAIILMHKNSAPATSAPPATQHQSTPSKPVHVVPPRVNPLLPHALHIQLDHYPLVIAGFYNPHSPVDMLSIHEARTAAHAAHIPFVPVNLLNDKMAGPLTALLPAGELLPNPGFMIYRRPGAVVYRSDGYLDEAGVTQIIRDTRR